MNYFCPRCEVWRDGDACWSCGTTDVVTRGPVVDNHVYGWPRSETRHVFMAAGAR